MGKRRKKFQEFKLSCSFGFPDSSNPRLLGNKGANLAEMTKLGLPVPPGFTLTTEAWRAFNQEEQLPDKVWQETLAQLKILEEKTGRNFGDKENPLIVSVRSGSQYSMPGMMETILNVGLNEETKKGLAKQTNGNCAEDSYQRLKTMFEKTIGEELPQDPFSQLRMATEAVFRSWNNPRAKIFRKYNGIPEEAGTAATIQKMVFGNIADGKSGTGVFFTRDPRTGEKRPRGEFVFAGQGEDVVQERRKAQEIPPELINQLEEYGKKLEAYFRAPFDIEFTVEKGSLYLLQSRELKGASLAKIKMALDFSKEGLITQEEAYKRVTPTEIQTISRPSFESKALQKARKDSLIGQGKPASIGVAKGLVVFTPEEVKELSKKGKPVILVCERLDPNDMETFFSLQALITTLGGTASHMALISQALGKVAVTGVEFKKRPQKGEWLSVNGNGKVFSGRIPLAKKTRLSSDVEQFIKEWREVWGESPWAVALYPTKKRYSRRSFLKRVKAITSELKKWPSDKAQTIILLNTLLPQEEIIPAIVLKPDDIEGIRHALKKVAQQEGRQNIPRTCHHPEKLTRAPWAVIPNFNNIERFLTDPHFPGKYGGLPRWREDRSLVGIIIPAEPKGKLDPKLTSQHFVFTVSCLPSQPPKVIVDLLLEVQHLRKMEEAFPPKLIQIIANLNFDSPYYLGEIEVVFGRDYQNNPYAQKVTQLVKEKVFSQWWRPPFSLPHVMAALDETYELSVLEGQGRMKDREKLAWCFVYGAKGREEKEKVKEIRW